MEDLMDEKELLYDYTLLFDILELDFLPGEDTEDWDIMAAAVVEYYNYLLDFNYEYFNNSPEVKRGCNALRRLLHDLGEANFTTMEKVWGVAATLDDNLILLQFSLPHLEWMWN
jgi:hypothetical protein